MRDKTPIGAVADADRPDMPTAMRLKLDMRIHRQRLALRENWQIVDTRLWARTVRPANQYLMNAMRIMSENRDLRARLAEASAELARMRGKGTDGHE